MAKEKKTHSFSEQLASLLSRKSQKGTDATIESMERMKYKADRVANVGYDQSKGNMFEYMEDAKLNRNLANAGHSLDGTAVTDAPKDIGGFGDPHAPDDFRLTRNGKTISQGQAKVYDNSRQAAEHLADDKYRRMQRNAPIDQIEEISENLDKLYKSGKISRRAYLDAKKNLSYEGLTDPETGISSGGTTRAELEKLRGADGKISLTEVEKYARRFEMEQFMHEVSETTRYGAETGFIISGLFTSAKNAIEVAKGEKKVDEALYDVTKSSVAGGVHGATVGAVGSTIRIAGQKVGATMLADSSVATVLAGGVIDSALYLEQYATGKITAEQLSRNLEKTMVQSSATVCITQTTLAMVTSISPLGSLIIYSVAGNLVSLAMNEMHKYDATTEEYVRMAALVAGATAELERTRAELNRYISEYRADTQAKMTTLLDSLETNVIEKHDYEAASNSLILFANQMGMELQYTDFNKFSADMRKRKKIRL